MSTDSSSTRPLKIVLIVGSTRNGRQATRVSPHVEEALKAKGAEVSVLDAESVNFDKFVKPFHHYKPEEEVPAEVARWAAELTAADGFAIVSPEYNHTPSPAVLAVIDHFYHGQYKFKAAGIFTYSWSQAGGCRAAYVLRNTLGELGLVTTPTNLDLYLGSGFEADNVTLSSGAKGKLDKVVSELVWYANALREARKGGLPY
jgi:NAD(P)H-dependent FMN reductase